MDMFDIEPQQLLVTPVPHHGESYMGFLLRTSEANGYSSVNTILRHAGLSENEMRSARPPLAKLAPLYGRKVEDFAALGDTVTTNGRYLPVMGHLLPAIYLRSKHARLCPDCVEEDGHISAFWELRHATACHRHRKKALETCPVCERKLDWWRTGLATCACGHDLREEAGDEVASVAVVTVLGVIEAKLRGEELKEESLSYAGFPITGLKTMSLSTLLGILYRLENFLETQDGVSPEHAALETAADIFNAWPTGFHRYLERVHAPKADMQANGLRGQFESFYEAFFKQGLPKEEMRFMHEAFVQFGQHHWKQASIHPQLLGKGSSNIVGIEGLAKAIGVMPATARMLVATGTIPVHAHHPKNGRMLFDLSQQMPFAFAEGKSLSLDSAAQILDLPVTVLRAYRARGYYQARHLASPMKLFHERDVAELKAELIKDCNRIKIRDEVRYKTLRKIMLLKLGPSEVKAALIDAIRKRKIIPIGIAGELPGDLVLEARAVKEFLLSMTDGCADSISVDTCIELLDCDAIAIRLLIKQGYLEFTNSEFGVRITRESFDRFNSKFISLRAVSILKKLTRHQLKNLCDEMAIDRLTLDQNHISQRNIFIHRQYLPLLGITALEAAA
jgi:hypothetical protein